MSNRTMWRFLSVVVLLLATGPVLGQSAAKPGERKAAGADKAQAAKPEGEPASRGFLGDPKRFTRFGGWGSIGGAMGQFGMARTTLVMMPPVQQELKLTESQKERIRDWLDAMRKSGEDMGRKMREQGGDPMEQQDVPIAARVMQFTSMMGQISNLLRENENGLAKILDAPQRKRLNQISLQMEGVSALGRPDVAEALNLDPDQMEMVQNIITQSRLMQMTTWIQQGVAMAAAGRNRRDDGAGVGPEPRRPAARGRAAREKVRAEKPADKDKATDEEEGTKAEADRKAREQQFRQQFESMRDRTDRVQEQAVREILKVLTKRQRANFDRMLGEPFDPTKINNLGRPRDGQNRPPGDN